MVKPTRFVEIKHRGRVWKITALIEGLDGGPPIQEYFLVAARHRHAAIATLREKQPYLLDNQCDVVGETAPAFLNWLNFGDNKVYRVLAEADDVAPERARHANQLGRSIMDMVTAKKPHRDAAREEQRKVWQITAQIECLDGGLPMQEYFLIAAADSYAAVAALRKNLPYLLDTQCDVIGEALPAFLDWLDFADDKVYRVMAETYDIPPQRTKDPSQLVKSIIDRATAKKTDRDPAPEEERKDPAAVSAASDEPD